MGTHAGGVLPALCLRDRKAASVIPAVETCLQVSSDSLRSVFSGSLSGLYSSKCRREVPSASQITGRVDEI